MFSTFFTNWKLRRLARQLRKPVGTEGHRTGQMMNKANATLYHFTLGCMQLPVNGSVLEIGFGNGRFFTDIFGKAPGLQLSGLDYSADMVEAAHMHNREYVAAGRLTLQQGTSEKMPFPDNHFDVIFCINVVYFWDEPAAHLQEVKRVLKPGGLFFATIRSAATLQQLAFTRYGFRIWTTADWQQVIRENGLEWADEYDLSEPEVAFEGKMMQLDAQCLVARKP